MMLERFAAAVSLECGNDETQALMSAVTYSGYYRTQKQKIDQGRLKLPHI